MRISTLGKVALALLTLSCTTRDFSQPVGELSTEQRREIDLGTHDLDILFVIDNSGSMGDKQESLRDNFRTFIEVLEQTVDVLAPSGVSLPSVHIGVVSSDIGAGSLCGSSTGDDGRLRTCSAIDDDFIADESNEQGGRQQNYSGSLESAFDCIAQVGTEGCFMEGHFEAMRRALEGESGRGKPFLRKDAYLAVIFIADEDDCSPKSSFLYDEGYSGNIEFRCVKEGITCDQQIRETDGSYTNCQPKFDSQTVENPQVYVDFLKTLKPDSSKLIVAGIVGDPSPVDVDQIQENDPFFGPITYHAMNVCPGRSSWGAEPGVRFKYFLDQFPQASSVFTSLCNTDLSPALVEISRVVAKAIGSPCLADDVRAEDLDRNPQNGRQIDCVLSDEVEDAAGKTKVTVIPPCVMSAENQVDRGRSKPVCWWVERNTEQCKTGPNLVLRVERGVKPAAGAKLIAKCALAKK